MSTELSTLEEETRTIAEEVALLRLEVTGAGVADTTAPEPRSAEHEGQSDSHVASGPPA